MIRSRPRLLIGLGAEGGAVAGRVNRHIDFLATLPIPAVGMQTDVKFKPSVMD
jgi:hypothetical protein